MTKQPPEDYDSFCFKVGWMLGYLGRKDVRSYLLSTGVPVERIEAMKLFCESVYEGNDAASRDAS